MVKVIGAVTTGSSKSPSTTISAVDVFTFPHRSVAVKVTVVVLGVHTSIVVAT